MSYVGWIARHKLGTFDWLFAQDFEYSLQIFEGVVLEGSWVDLNGPVVGAFGRM